MRNWKQQIFAWFRQKALEHVSWSTLVQEYYRRPEASGSSPAGTHQYKRQAIMLGEKTIDDWRLAVASATDPDDPRRGLLYRFYQSLYLDEHLQTTIDNRVLPVQQSEFRMVDKNGKENEEATKLLKRPWFHELIYICFLHRLQGVSLADISRLDDNMEIASVEEIPMSNYIPQQGIILREESDTTGWSYKEGALEPYYVQFGNPWALGILNELAITILAKKLGLGSWMNYIEKFGIPPVFVISDRQDKRRLDELYEMMLDFKNSMFGVLGGQERVEYGKEAGGNTTNAFLPLEERCDDQISKRLLGQTGTTKNGPYEGTAEVHERVEKSRHESDKMLFQFYFNYIIIPKLVKISPVYRPLENLTLEWDDTETLSIKDYIDSINKLAYTFEFDPEEVAKRTGLPIIGQKNNGMGEQSGGPQPTPPAPEPQKKKSEPRHGKAGIAATINALYYPDGKMPEDAGGFGLADKIRDRILNRLRSKGFDVENDIDPDLFAHTFKYLEKAVKKSFGNPEYGTRDDGFFQELRHNNAVFAAFKAHRQQNEMYALLTDEEGNLKSFDRFRKDTEKITQNYNVNWLRTEYDTSVRRARFAADFRGYQANKDLYPNLEWLSSVSVHPREAHRGFYGMIRSADDSFWMNNYPGNLWNCKCRVKSTDKPVNATGEGKAVPAAPGLDKNPAMTAELFTDTHPYIKGASDKAKIAVEEFVDKLEISSKMPKELRPESDYLAGKGIRFKKEFFDLLDDTPGKDIRLKIEKSGELSYYTPNVTKVRKGKKIVDFPENERRTVHITLKEKSDWARERVVYHEFGHAIDEQKGLRNTPELIELMKNVSASLHKKKEYTIYKEVHDYEKNIFKDIRAKAEMPFIEYTHKRLYSLYIKVKRMQEDTFAKRGISKDDVIDQISATLDTLQAINYNYGHGHSKEYYKIPGRSEAEFIAHCFENAFAGNRIFEKFMPDEYKLTKQFIKGLIPQ